MKRIFVLLIIMSFFGCKAQQVVSINDSDYGKDGHYFKDLQNDYGKLEGVWKYTGENNTTLTIVLKKITMAHVENTFSNYYTDALVGEHKYVENGILKTNTQQNINLDYENPSQYSIDGGTIAKYNSPLCEECNESDIKVFCSYYEPDCLDGPRTRMAMRYYLDNNIEKIDINFHTIGSAIYNLDPEADPPCESYNLPYGEYTLVKQE